MLKVWKIALLVSISKNKRVEKVKILDLIKKRVKRRKGRKKI